MANRIPLIVDVSDSNKIKEIPSGDNLQLSGNSIVGVVSITGSGTLTIENISANNITLGGTSLSDVATSGNYSDLTGSPTNVSSFTNDSGYVTSGSNISVFANDSGYLTTVAFADLTATPTTLAGYGITDAATSAQGALADSAVQPGSNVSTLNNDAGYITVAQVQSGDLTVDVNNSGDLIGSVFGQDSTLLVDGVLSGINLDGTVKGNIIPNVDGFYDLGSADNQFRNAYISSLGTTGQDVVIASNLLASAGDGSTNIGTDVERFGTAYVWGTNYNTITYTGGSGTPETLVPYIEDPENGNIVQNSLFVLNADDGSNNGWVLPDGVEGQIVHFVPGTGAATNQHLVTIQNWRRWDEGAGVAGEWRVVTGLDWIPFLFDNTPRYRSMATAVFVNGAWQTDTGWID